MQYVPSEREARYLYFILQRPVDLICVPYLLARAVLILETGSPKNLSKWDAATSSDQQVNTQTFVQYPFGVLCGKRRGVFR